jgi:hypothetical protein
MLNPGQFQDGVGSAAGVLLNLAPASVGAAAVREDTFSLTGPQTMGDVIYVATGGAGFTYTVAIPVYGRVPSANNIAIVWVNASAGAAIPANGQHRITWFH